MKAQAEVSVLSNEMESLSAKLSTCEMERNILLCANEEFNKKNGTLERELETCTKFGKKFEAMITSLELELKSVKATSLLIVDVDLRTQPMINAQGGVGFIKGLVSTSKASTFKDESTQGFVVRDNIT
ncbi:hypothetical protein CsSME_00042759 [Camellia sinensis var. sinensis]